MGRRVSVQRRGDLLGDFRHAVLVAVHTDKRAEDALCPSRSSNVMPTSTAMTRRLLLTSAVISRSPESARQEGVREQEDAEARPRDAASSAAAANLRPG